MDETSDNNKLDCDSLKKIFKNCISSQSASQYGTRSITAIRRMEYCKAEYLDYKYCLKKIN